MDGHKRIEGRVKICQFCLLQNRPRSEDAKVCNIVCKNVSKCVREQECKYIWAVQLYKHYNCTAQIYLHYLKHVDSTASTLNINAEGTLNELLLLQLTGDLKKGTVWKSSISVSKQSIWLSTGDLEKEIPALEARSRSSDYVFPAL